MHFVSDTILSNPRLKSNPPLRKLSLLFATFQSVNTYQHIYKMVDLKNPRRKLLIVLFCFCATTIVLFSSSNTSSYLSQLVSRWSDKPVSRALCACRQCISVKDEDPWFMKRFNTSISPLLSQKNAMLSDDTFKWWQRLQTKQNANYSAVVQKLFQVVPGEGHYNDSGPNRCRTCAVVGNSGNLKGSDYGALIDSNDFIIRMNKAPILGYEKDVGNRTTHRVMYPESATNLQKDTSLLLIPFKTLDLEWITSALTTGTVKRTRMPVMAKINADKNKVLIYNPTFLKYVYDVWLERHGKYPSTGFSTLMFAIHVCDEVNVFGFGASKDGTWQHYWEKNKFKRTKPTGVHAGDYESIVMKLLACEKN